MHLLARLPPNSSLRSIAMGRAIYFNANVSDAMAILPTTPCTAIAVKTEDFDQMPERPAKEMTPVGASRPGPPVDNNFEPQPVRSEPCGPETPSRRKKFPTRGSWIVSTLSANSFPRCGSCPFLQPQTDGSENRGFLPMATKDYAEYVHRSCLACQKRIPRWTDGKPTPKSKLFCSAACRQFHPRLPQ